MKYKLLYIPLLASLLCACSSNTDTTQKQATNTKVNTITAEYKTENTLAELFNKPYISSDILPNFNEVGVYEIKYQEQKKFDKNNKDVVTNEATIMVKDTKSPVLKKRNQIEYDFDTFNISSCIKQTFESIDEKSINEVNIQEINKSTFDEIEKKSKMLKTKKENRVFKDGKMPELKHEYMKDVSPSSVYATYTVKGDKEKQYTVSLIAVDENYLTSKEVIKLNSGNKKSNKNKEEKKEDKQNQTNKTPINHDENRTEQSNKKPNANTAKPNISNTNKPKPETNKPQNPTPKPSINDDITDVTGYVDECFKYINNYRVSKGLAPFKTTRAIQEKADARAKELIDNFSHNTNLNLDVPGYLSFAENIEMGGSPIGAFNDWKNSPLHNEHLLSSYGQYAGLGCRKNSFGRTYWVLIVYTVDE